LLSALQTMIAASPLIWTTRHIEGHQDDDATAQVDFWVKQNIQMDNLAKVVWMQQSHSAPVLYPVADEGFQVWLGDHKLSSTASFILFDHIHGRTILYWHMPHTIDSQLVTLDASIGTYVQTLSTACLLADADGLRNILPGFAVLEPRWFNGRNNRFRLALAAVLTKMGNMYGSAKNRLSFCFGPF
jgi:hypothetical protein